MKTSKPALAQHKCREENTRRFGDALRFLLVGVQLALNLAADLSNQADPDWPEDMKVPPSTALRAVLGLRSTSQRRHLKQL